METSSQPSIFYLPFPLCVLLAGTDLVSLAKLGHYSPTGLEDVKEDKVVLLVHQEFSTWGLPPCLLHLLQITLQSTSTQATLLESKQTISTGKNTLINFGPSLDRRRTSDFLLYWKVTLCSHVLLVLLALGTAFSLLFPFMRMHSLKKKSNKVGLLFSKNETNPQNCTERKQKSIWALIM